jgi:hypothetical protein
VFSSPGCDFEVAVLSVPPSASPVPIRARSRAKSFLIIGGMLYPVLWLYRLLIDPRQRRQLRTGQHRRQLAAPRPGVGMVTQGAAWT